MTPSQARNAIKRSLKAIIDPKPSKVDKAVIWQHFKNQCAYCGCDLDPKERKAHLDHVIAESEGGSNRLCNLILTCATCNGDEKRELDWQAFLQQKCQNEPLVYQQRLKKIQDWFDSQKGSVTISLDQQVQLNSAFDAVNTVYSDVVEELCTSQKN